MEFLKAHVKVFDERLVFDSEKFNANARILEPSASDIAAYCKYVTIASKMENE